MFERRAAWRRAVGGRVYAALAAGAVVGALVGLAIAFAHSTRYRAETSVVVAPALKRTDPALSTITHTVASLARSDAVARNVVTSLRLGESPGALRGDIHAHAVRGTALVEIGVDQGSALGAERALQQVVVVLQRLAAGRLAGVVPGSLVVWDAPTGSAHALGRPYASWIIGGASIGLLLAAGGLLAPGLGRQRNPRGASEEPRSRLRDPDVPENPVVAGVSNVEQPPPAPFKAEAAAPAAEGPGLRGTSEESQTPNAGHIAELRRRADAEADPRRQAEMHAYLDQLAPFAGPDGDLPPNLIGLAEDVFGPFA